VLISVGAERLEAASFGEANGAANLLVPVVHQGEELGALEVTMPANDPLDPSRGKLVHDLAVQLRLLEQTAGKDPERDRQLAAKLGSQANAALEDLRDLARGIYPPLLADKGLGAAVEAQARKAAVPTTVTADGIQRYPQEIEAAVYFCVLEALNNVAKYASATRAAITLTQTDGQLTFEVGDDGSGFDVERARDGTGLQGMADRLDAIGGSLTVRSVPGEGSTVGGRVPLAQTPA
jgi:signal transduction histidine kinase